MAGPCKRGRCLSGAAAVLLLLADPAAAGTAETSVALMAGQMTWGDFGTIAYDPGGIEWADSRFIGVALARDRALGDDSRFRVGYEAMLIQHTGVNDHVELDLPLTLRYRALSSVIPVQGAAFGLGVSLASSPPRLEDERKGFSQRVLPHWFMELELGRPGWRVAPFLRIHHRSDGFVFAAHDTGSNGVGLGLRARF